MQPGGEGRFAAKSANLAEKLKESLLHQVLRISGISDHPQAEGIDPAAMELVKKLKSSCISGLGQTDSL
jgi:hypothetical protein